MFLRATVNADSAEAGCLYYNRLDSGAYSEVACGGPMTRPSRTEFSPIDLDLAFSPECDL